MPSRRRSKVLVGKQKKLIATRLMQISLLVDDYLYKQKPISTSSCEAYIKEISSYQTKCFGDIHSLQVIEKLTRYMRAIIAEEQELNEWDKRTNDVPFEDTSKYDYRDLSPVYSFEDEGLTQSPEAGDILPKNCEELSFNMDSIETSCLTRLEETEDRLLDREVRDHHDKDELVGDLCNDETQVIIDLRNDDVEEIIDKNIEQINKSRNISSITSEFNIHRAISCLTIQDIEDVSMTIPFTQEYSQSILNNFSPWNNEAQTELNTTLTEDYENVIRAASIQRKAVHKTSNAFKPINAVILPDHKASMAHTGTIPKVNVPAKVHTDNKPLTKKKTKVIESTHSNETVTNVKNNKNTSAKSVTKKLEVPKRNVKATAKRKKQVLQPKPVVSSDECNTKTSLLKNKLQDKQVTYNLARSTYGQNMSNPINTTKIKKNKANHKNLPDIYNGNIVEDLSWVENIRFVREVSPEEFISITNDRDFWENCTLPAYYSDADFK